MPIISIILPVYNAEKYLGKCLDSLKVQTFPDIEILCVDDGSQDGSCRICEEYVMRMTGISPIFARNCSK